MCGINGIFAYHYASNPIDRNELIRTRDHMIRRGLDGFGEWVSTDGHLGLGHRRLSIIDLSDAAAQPMCNADQSIVVAFNGEIYNFKELRQELESKGCIFRTQSDTEVLLHLYADRGEEMVHDLRGMFAFAIWDAKRGELFLARDPYGIKPLYYADDGWTFRFASQVKALVAGGKISELREPAGLVGFYLWGSVPEPFTLYQEVRALPAGSTMRVDAIGAHAPKSYFSVAQVYWEAEQAAKNRQSLPLDQVQEKIRSALLESVKYHLVSDVPVGVFLSAGIDSGALLGLMRDAGADQIQTITIGFEEFVGTANDETVLAEDVARHYGTKHTTRIVTREEFEADLPKILEAMDQLTIDGLNTWFVSKAAKELGLKVAISGLGGDELFGGYPSFRDVPKLASLTAAPSRIPLFGRVMRIFMSRFAQSFRFNPKASGLLEIGGTFEGAYFLKRGLFMPWELSQILGRGMFEVGLRRLKYKELVRRVLEPRPRSEFAKVATLESSLYMRNQLLRDADWASMAHGLEIRVPLVDHMLLKELAPFGGYIERQGKRLLASSPSKLLPDSILSKSKTGFTTPIADWIQGSKLNSRRGFKLRGQPWARNWSRSVGELSGAVA